MATVVTDQMTYTRVLTETLSEGRTARATVTATGVKVGETVTKNSTINLNQPNNMTEEELTVYQTFIDGLDEIAQELENALYVAPPTT